MSARSAVALQQGADEELLAAVDHYEQSDLSPVQQAALRLADTYLGLPAAMSDAVRQDVGDHLTSVQAVEIVLKLMGFSSDKVMVALGLDFEEIRPFTM
jgi:alkylhydroperoxidase family enzyme